MRNREQRKIIVIVVMLFFVSLCSVAGQESSEENYDDSLDFGEAPKDLTVVGTPETTQQMTVIDRETIEKSGARDLAALLMGNNFTFFASLRNILNAHYEFFASYYMPGISLVIGVRAKFNIPSKQKQEEKEQGEKENEQPKEE